MARPARSSPDDTPAGTPASVPADPTGPPKLGPSGADRIVEAAIELFGAQGFTGTSLKAIADRAGVSAPLVIHHFGSKAGLRTACDIRVADLVHQLKSESIAASHPATDTPAHTATQPALPRHHVMEALHASGPLIRYLLQALLAGGEEIDALMDRLLEDFLEYTAEAERVGLMNSSENPRNRAIVLLLQSFGALMLHQQMKRLLGVSPVDDPPEELAPYMSTVLELYTRPLLDEQVYGELAQQLRHHEPDPTGRGTTHHPPPAGPGERSMRDA
ncbi:TetR/AcrR family transcriptional regulator [Nesterenkonia suensis]